MTFRDILAVLTSYPEPTSAAAVADAVDFAGAIGSNISAIACAVRLRAPRSALPDVFLDIPAMVAAEARRSLANAQEVLDIFQNHADKNGLFQDRILEHCLISDVPALLVEYSRLRDLTIVPEPQREFSDAIIFGSGRPTLIMPSTRKREKIALDTVVVAWDFSRCAARAVADSLPLLERAKQVYVVTITNEKIIDTRRSGAELAKHLARHNVEVVLDTADAAGREIGSALESYLASRDADLLVMGAYGHSRLRDFILGGVTQTMLSQPPIPIFLSH